MEGVKRKSGRPKRSSNLQPTINKHEEMEAPPLKRSRGRPRKNILDPKPIEGERIPPHQNGLSIDGCPSFDPARLDSYLETPGWLYKIELPDEIIPEMFVFENCSLKELMKDAPEPSGQDDEIAGPVMG
ncbi:hypothetical protein QJS10_CPA08g00325 [Acorus calamus]|uniref:Uncharacterized protein n=1 Tax=Acorus calamus TaxID=4465 RepID=A0AAV9EAU5_ACOCL|nr:hypothetical protein QJS10_CPA08g00325 [Acorus calamus]